MKRRIFLSMVTVAVLSGCAVSPLVPAETASQINLREILVDVSSFEGIRGRDFSVAPTQLQQDIAGALASQFTTSPQGNAVMRVTVDQVSLVSPGQSLLLGGTSTIKGTVSISNVASGSDILPVTEVSGLADGSYAPGGIIGALSTKSPENDYENTVASFASDVKNRLFGAN